MNFLKKLYTTLFLFIVFGTSNGFADDIGITSARLIQLSDTSYLFEADATAQFLNMISKPVFPDRFEVSDLEYTNNSGWILIKATATTNGDPLNANDEILLPWLRNGVSLTVQWKDGTMNRGFYTRELDGIHVPLNTLMPVDKTLWEVSYESFLIGVSHIPPLYIHLLLIIVLAIMLSPKKLFKILLWYAFGQGFSLILIEFGVPGFDLLFTDILIVLFILFAAFSIAKKIEFRNLNWLLLLIGIFHGLSAGKELTIIGLPFEQKLPAVFMFNVAIDTVQFGFAFLLIPLIKFVKTRDRIVKVTNFLIGIISVALILGMFNERVFTGKTDVLSLEESQQAARKNLPSPKAAQAGGNRPQGAKTLTSPIMTYLSVEPFEVRQEILVNARTALQIIDVPEDGMGSLPVELQEMIMEQTLELFENSNPIRIDGQEVDPALTRIDFVTLGSGGVIIRHEPVRESLDEGILGISLVYETETLANDITIDWELFSDDYSVIEAITIDPFGGASFVLAPDDKVLYWKRTMSGYTVPKVEEIAIEHPKLPIVSVIIFIVAIVLLFILKKQNRNIAFILLGIGLVLYPFLRYPLDVAFVNQWKPSSERSTRILDGLLTNVYRSFDYRNEEAVYDRLSISVMGDQLTKTYIEQRKGLEIENRGGASAKVEKVEILEIHNVISGAENDFGIEATWTINGSVSHFGHMHYRQNRYRAVIWISPKDGNWKISNIEMIDETRLL